MSDKPTKKPVLATSSEPKPPMASGKIVKPEMGITIMPMPAKPKAQTTPPHTRGPMTKER